MKKIKFKIQSILMLAFVALSMQFATAQDATGSWKGTLAVQGMEVPLVFNVSEEANVLLATMDSPSQGATGLPMDETTLIDKELTIVFKQAGIKYVGIIDGDKISGTFYQAGMEFPLVLEKTVKMIPGNTALPSSDEALKALAAADSGNFKYSVADYFAKPNASSFNYSPNGKYISYMEKDKKGKRHVYVKEIATEKVTRAIEEKEELIRGYGWVNNNRLVYLMDQGGDENYHLYAADLDGSNQKDLTPFEGVQANFLELLKEDKDHIIISLNKNNPQVFDPYKVNVVTGEMEQLYKNEDIKSLYKIT